MSQSLRISCVGYGVLNGENARKRFVELVNIITKDCCLRINAIATNDKGFKFGEDIFEKLLRSSKLGSLNSALGFQCKRDISVPGEYDAYFFLNPNPSSMGIFINKEIFFNKERSLMDLLSNFAKEFSPEYGYACSNLNIDYPELYAVGLNSNQTLGFSGKEYEASLSISRWSSIGMRKKIYKLGFLRDVYEYNLLNREHRTRKIDGSTLENWIEGKGIVEKVSESLWIWKVPFSDLDLIRDVLNRAKIIFDWRSFSDTCVN